MSMEVVAPVRNLSVRRTLSARAIRERLMRPPNGRDSSELEIVPEYLARIARIEAEERRKGLLREARHRRARELLGLFARKLETWVAQAGDIPAEPIIPHVTVKQIIDAASVFYDVPVIHIMSERRKANFVRPRRMVMYLAYKHTECSFPMIGARLGGRDHTTCFTGVEAITKLVLDGDQKTIDDLAALRAKLGLEGE